MNQTAVSVPVSSSRNKHNSAFLMKRNDRFIALIPNSFSLNSIFTGCFSHRVSSICPLPSLDQRRFVYSSLAAKRRLQIPPDKLCAATVLGREGPQRAAQRKQTKDKSKTKTFGCLWRHKEDAQICFAALRAARLGWGCFPGPRRSSRREVLLLLPAFGTAVLTG